MTIGHDWQEMSGTVVAEIEAWIVAPPSDGFAANVNVLTQKAPGIDLQGYRDLSIKNGDRVMQNFELIDSGVVKGPSGSTLGWMDFTGRSGGRDLRFLAVYGLLNGQARLATLTAPPDNFSELRSRIEPYLLTLIPT